MGKDRELWQYLGQDLLRYYGSGQREGGRVSAPMP